jgi:hypothetical protein
MMKASNYEASRPLLSAMLVFDGFRSFVVCRKKPQHQQHKNAIFCVCGFRWILPPSRPTVCICTTSEHGLAFVTQRPTSVSKQGRAKEGYRRTVRLEDDTF